MSVLEAYNASIAAAIDDGTLDTVKNGAIIEAARKVAALFDNPDWPIVNGKLDNVSPSVFLKYCEALHIAPDAEIPQAKPKSSRLTMMVNASKFSRAANE